jgi:hypothetical protein
METLTAVQTLRELVRENGQKLFDDKQLYAFRLDEHAVLAICECGCGALSINIDGNGPLHISDDEKEASEILETVRLMGLLGDIEDFKAIIRKVSDQYGTQTAHGRALGGKKSLTYIQNGVIFKKVKGDMTIMTNGEIRLLGATLKRRLEGYDPQFKQFFERTFTKTKPAQA